MKNLMRNESVQNFQQCSVHVQNVQNFLSTCSVLFRICSEYSVLFRICSVMFSIVQNLFSNVQYYSESVQYMFSNVKTLFRLSSTKTGLFRLS